jgi:hypothetical protein
VLSLTAMIPIMRVSIDTATPMIILFVSEMILLFHIIMLAAFVRRRILWWETRLERLIL